jgi:molybdate transport system ATP-binding protein
MRSNTDKLIPSAFAVKLDFKRQSFHLNVDINIPNQGITAIFGPSGCGKTSLLRCIAGLDTPDSGRISLGEQCWFGDNISIATEKRAVGFVFQHSQLFPHLNVEQNLFFSNKMTGQQLDSLEYDSLIQLLDIGKLLKQYPNTLSGGERQRVAIARALLRQPSMLLFDEPLASLDEQRKNKILDYLVKLKQHLTIPIIYVSHSREEVVKLADHIIFMSAGKVEQQGPIEEVIEQLTHAPVMREEPFVVWFGERVVSEDKRVDSIQCAELDIRVAGGSANKTGVCRLRLYAKDVSIAIEPVENSSILNIFAMQIEAIEAIHGSHQELITLQHGPQRLLAKISSYSKQHLGLQVGMKVFAQIKAVSILA